MWGRSFLIFGLSAAGALAQTDPAWWSGVIRSGDSHALENNYAPANLGQLKNFTDQARLHLNANLSGGSGIAIESLVAGWTGTSDGNYVPINLGQLKSVADTFYARLDEVGFDYKSQLLANGYAGVWTTIAGGAQRPWNESTAPDTNYAPANIGQLKILFSFDVSGFDTDLDGIPDSWEQSTFGNLTHDRITDTDGDGVSDVDEITAATDWNDFYNGTAPVLTIVSGNNQGDLPGATLAVPLKVRLSNSHGVAAHSGVVFFVITSGTGGSLHFGGPNSVDPDGTVQTVLTLPSGTSTIGTTITVRASTSYAPDAPQVIFRLSVGDANLAPAAPGTPVITAEHGTTTALVEWDDNSNNETAFYIYRALNGANWTQIGTVNRNVTSYTDNSIVADAIYFYRIVAHNDAP